MSSMENLTQYRAKHGLSQRAFADLVGVDKSIISKIEAKKAKPGLELAGRIERETGGKVKAVSWIEALAAQ
jgi:DNA-binding XRE family transcriptional regulator